MPKTTRVATLPVALAGGGGESSRSRLALEGGDVVPPLVFIGMTRTGSRMRPPLTSHVLIPESESTHVRRLHCASIRVIDKYER